MVAIVVVVVNGFGVVEEVVVDVVDWQSSSSELSLQSGKPSQNHRELMHSPFSHWNSSL